MALYGCFYSIFCGFLWFIGLELKMLEYDVWKAFGWSKEESHPRCEEISNSRWLTCKNVLIPRSFSDNFEFIWINMIFQIEERWNRSKTRPRSSKTDTRRESYDQNGGTARSRRHPPAVAGGQPPRRLGDIVASCHSGRITAMVAKVVWDE